MATGRSISALAQSDGRVYVYLADEVTGRRFLEAAQEEGFTFPDRVLPTQRHYAEIMAVDADGTLHYVGAVGRIAFGAGAERIGESRLLRVDFQRYAAGEREYLMRGYDNGSK